MWRKFFIIAAIEIAMIVPIVMHTEEDTRHHVPEQVVGYQREPQELKEQKKYSDEDIEWLAKTAFAEAGNQGYQGQRYVVCVLLNRKSHKDYPNSIYGVISEKHHEIYQFESFPVAISKATPTEETYKAVYDELENRSNTEILAFRTGHYHGGGYTDCFKYKDHYFSK